MEKQSQSLGPENKTEKQEIPAAQKAANTFLEGFSLEGPLYERGELEPVEVTLDFGKRLQAFETALLGYADLSLTEQEAIIGRIDQFLQGASLVNQLIAKQLQRAKPSQTWRSERFDIYPTAK